MSSIFRFSNSDYLPARDEAYDDVYEDHVHPIVSMAYKLGTPIEQAPIVNSQTGKPYKETSFKTRFSMQDKLADRFLFPEPRPLLELCFYLQVHPAHLIPEDMRYEPAPRSIIQACRLIAADHRFGDLDRELAEDFLDREMQTCYEISEKDATLWGFIENLTFLVEQSNSDYTLLEWGRNARTADEINRATKLADKFSTVTADHVYPLSPDTMHVYDSMLWDLSALKYVESQRQIEGRALDRATSDLIHWGDKIFGEGNAMEAYEETRKVVKHLTLENPPSTYLMNIFIGQIYNNRKYDHAALGFDSEEAMSDKWLTVCRNFALASVKYDQRDSVYIEDKEKFDSLYNPGFTNAQDFDLTLAAFENYTIINSERIIPEGWEAVIQANAYLFPWPVVTPSKDQLNRSI